MFMADMLLPGPVGTAMSGVAVCAAAGGALYAFRRKIPHPTEFEPIGKICFFCKCHTHKKFDLIITVAEAENLPKGSTVYLYAECGRFDAQTQTARTDDNTQQADFYERLNIHVRQKDLFITFAVYKKLTLSSEHVGSITLNIEDNLIGEDYPTNKWYTVTKDGKNTAKVRLSFYRLEPGSKDISPLLQQALIQTQYEAAAKGEAPPLYDFNNMEPKDRLVLLSKALEGPLKMMKASGMTKWSSFYFRLIESEKGLWEWNYWKKKNDAYTGEKRIGKIYMLSISNVLPDPGNRHQFYVKYHDHKSAHDLMFMRVDRDRDVWSDGLYEFLDRLRDYLEKYPMHQSKLEGFVATEKKKKIKPRPKVVLPESVRRVAIAKGGKDTSKPRAPQGLFDMANELYEDATESEEEDSDYLEGESSDDERTSKNDEESEEQSKVDVTKKNLKDDITAKVNSPIIPVAGTGSS